MIMENPVYISVQNTLTTNNTKSLSYAKMLYFQIFWVINDVGYDGVLKYLTVSHPLQLPFLYCTHFLSDIDVRGLMKFLLITSVVKDGLAMALPGSPKNLKIFERLFSSKLFYHVLLSMQLSKTNNYTAVNKRIHFFKSDTWTDY